jgi:hypothetical protein
VSVVVGMIWVRTPSRTQGSRAGRKSLDLGQGGDAQNSNEIGTSDVRQYGCMTWKIIENLRFVSSTSLSQSFRGD